MGRKKRQFIDKKNAHRFVLMHRSQQDPEYYREGGSKFVLHPADKATARALRKLGMGDHILGGSEFSREGPKAAPDVDPFASGPGGELREVDEMGLPVDGYDYRKHMASIDGGGTFVTRDGAVASSSAFAPKALSKVAEGEGASSGASAQAKDGASGGLALPGELFASEQEHDRMLEAITLRADKLDPEMRMLLEEAGGDVPTEMEDCVNTLDDDFMGQLMAAEADAPDEDVFDFEAHMARLMAQAEADEWGDPDDEEDLENMDLQELLARATGSRELRDIDVHFETVLANEYGDDEIGELDHMTFDERVAGTMELSADQVNQLVEAYLSERRAHKARSKEIGATNENEVIKEQNKQLAAAADLQDAADDVETAEAKLNPTDDVMLRHFGYDNKPREKWDCDTIVSTYSVLDNHPKLISDNSGQRRRRRRGRRRGDSDASTDAAATAETGPTTDAGSSAAQVPPDADADVDLSEFMGLSAGLAMGPGSMVLERTKTETAEEKRARKKLVKQQQRMRRQEKKSMREMFKEEKKLQKQEAAKIKAAAVPPPGTSTFRF